MIQRYFESIDLNEDDINVIDPFELETREALKYLAKQVKNSTEFDDQYTVEQDTFNQ